MVSVVILTRQAPNELGMIFPPAGLYEDLRNQTCKDFEIIWATEKGIVNAMNIALAKAKGDILVRVDDDVVLPSQWLEELIKPFQDPRVAGTTGPTFVPLLLRENRDSVRIAERPNFFLRWLFDGDPFAPAKIYKCGSVSYGSNFEEHIDRYGEYKIDHLEGTNWAARTYLIRRVGGFDPKFDGVAEWFDDDVVFKIKKLGYRIEYNPRAYLWHLLGKSANYDERLGDFGRIKNWLRFHWRHSRFHPKMIVWFCSLVTYMLWKRIRRR